MEPNFCLFFKYEKQHFGWIREFRKNKAVVLSSNNIEHLYSMNQLQYSWRDLQFSSQDPIEYLSSKVQWVFDTLSNFDLNTIHELCDVETPYTLNELSELFLDDPENGWLHCVLFLAIKQTPFLFQVRKQTIFARSLEQIKQLEKEAENQKIYEEKRLLEKQWCASLRQGKKPDIQLEYKEHWNSFCHRIHQCLLYLEKYHERKYFLELFELKKIEFLELEHQFLEFLNCAGIPLSWGKLQLSRLGLLEEFKKTVLEQAENLQHLNIWNSIQGIETLDERHLVCFTVDALETRDYDDAISYESSGGVQYFRVHITDVASYIKEESPLFEWAAQRISSVYTLKEVYPMLPHILSEGECSLKEGKERPVLTFCWKVLENGEEYFQLYRSIILVSKNLSYEEVDEKIEMKNSVWNALFDFARNKKQARLEQGALDLERKEVKLDISDPEHIQIQEVKRNTPSSLLIEEFAVQANYQAALYFHQKNYKAFFRTQEPYVIKSEIEETESLKLSDINMKPTKVSLESSRHSSLGLDCYTQVTSPIRRFSDLVGQHILLFLLADKECLFCDQKLLGWAKQIEEITMKYRLVERSLTNHWKMKYLVQNQEEIQEVECQRVLRNKMSLVVFKKLELYLEVNLQDMEVGKIYNVRIDTIDIKLNRIRVTKVDHLD